MANNQYNHKKNIGIINFCKIANVMSVFILLVSAVCLFSQNAIAVDYYVSPDGNNTNSGLSPVDAWGKPSYAVSRAIAGDTIHLMDGVWYNDPIVFRRSGTEAAPITLKAYNGTPTLDGVDQSTIGIVVSKNWVNIDNITIRNHQYGLYTRGSNNITIKNTGFYDNLQDGITLWTHNRDIYMDNVTVQNVTQHGIHIWHQGALGMSQRITIRNSSISNCPHNLIDIHTNVSNVIVENNELFYTLGYKGNKDVGVYLHNGNTDNIVIHNNYFHDFVRPIEIYNSRNVQITNNTFRNIPGKCVLLSSVTGYDDEFGVWELLVENNLFDNVNHVFAFAGSRSQFQDLNIVNNTYQNITSIDRFYTNIPYVELTLKTGYPEILVTTNHNYSVRDIINSNFIFYAEEPEVPGEQEGPNIPVPESSGSGTSFTPSATSFTASMGSSTNFIVNTDEQFTSTQWYFNGVAVASGTTYTQKWDTSGSFTVRFDGADDLGTASRTWNVVVTGSEYSAISVVPSASVVAPGETFSLDVYIDPKQPVTGGQLNLHYSTLASVTSVRDGGLFKTGGLSNTFQSGTIDNSAGVLRNVYSAIMGSGTVSTPGSMATVNMVAGASSGMLELTLSNVVLSDAYSNPAPYDITYASILVDTAPVLNAIPAMSVEEESALTFVVSATDADGDTLTYSGTSLPQGATFNAASRTFSWTPARGQAGTYTVGFEVTDGYLNDTAAAAITVASLNRAPVITLFEPASGSEFGEGQVINMRVVAEDPEGEPLSYSLNINGVQVSSSASYQWITDYSSAGTHTIGVTVSDGNSQTSQTHTVTILDVHPRWDVNMDGVVNILDITLVGQNYGSTYSNSLPRWDVNQDGIVNVQDLSIVAARFGETVQ
jgi:hypothetical protein